MSHLLTWLKEQVRKSHIKELIMTHTGLTPPAFFAVVALAAAGTAFTVSSVSSLLAPPKKIDDRSLDTIINEQIMSHTTSNQREINVISAVLETNKEEEEEEEEDPANDAEAPVKEEVADPAKEEEVEDPAKEEKVETTAPAAADGEDTISTGYVDFEETVA